VAISVLDIRDTVAPPRVRVPSRAAVATSSTTATRRIPAAVLAAGLIGILESVGLLAVALTGLDGVLDSAVRPSGWIIAGGLLLLAAWIVLCAGSGAALIDGAGRTLLMAVAYGEMALVALLLVVSAVTPLVAETPAGLPLPALGLMALAVPVGKLLLVGAPSALSWAAAGPRVRERRPDPVHTHRMLATLTLGVIGISLVALALLVPAEASGVGGDGGAPASSVVHQP
jgi:hypothetical protein